MKLADAHLEYEFSIAHLSPRSQRWSGRELHDFAAYPPNTGV
jgi:hypothetical protein